MKRTGAFDEDNPYTLRDNAVVGWILTYNNSPFIQKYVNRDVMHKILELLKMIEIPRYFMLYERISPGIYSTARLAIVMLWKTKFAYSIHINPCHICLLPTKTIHDDFCLKHKVDNQKCFKCKNLMYVGIGFNCFEKFKNTHILL